MLNWIMVENPCFNRIRACTKIRLERLDWVNAWAFTFLKECIHTHTHHTHARTTTQTHAHAHAYAHTHARTHARTRNAHTHAHAHARTHTHTHHTHTHTTHTHTRTHAPHTHTHTHTHINERVWRVHRHTCPTDSWRAASTWPRRLQKRWGFPSLPSSTQLSAPQIRAQSESWEPVYLPPFSSPLSMWMARCLSETLGTAQPQKRVCDGMRRAPKKASLSLQAFLDLQVYERKECVCVCKKFEGSFSCSWPLIMWNVKIWLAKHTLVTDNASFGIVSV